jgi:hypothetical protein
MMKTDRLQIFSWLVLLFVLGLAVNAVRTQRREIAELRQRLEVTHSEAKVQACIAKSTPAGNDTALAEQRAACVRNQNAPTVLDSSTVAPIGH